MIKIFKFQDFKCFIFGFIFTHLKTDSNHIALHTGLAGLIFQKSIPNYSKNSLGL
jgi:hypothetical protein